MKLGLEGKKAIVGGGSSGLGKAIASALSQEGAEVLILARDENKLAATAEEIQSLTGNQVGYASVDLSKAEQRATIIERCQETDILVNNSGGPPMGDYLNISHDQWLAALEANMLSAIELINASLPGMCDRGFGRVLNVTSHMVKSPVSALSLSNGARAGLTAYVVGIARDVARHNVTLNNLLPGQFETERLRQNHNRFAISQGVSLEETQKGAQRAIPAKRFGKPEEFGAYAAFLASEYAGYITGQNLLLDGGQYHGLL